MPIVILSHSGHYPDRVVKITQKELARIRKVEGDRYLFDTVEGRYIITELKAKPNIATLVRLRHVKTST